MFLFYKHSTQQLTHLYLSHLLKYIKFHLNTISLDVLLHAYAMLPLKSLETQCLLSLCVEHCKNQYFLNGGTKLALDIFYYAQNSILCYCSRKNWQQIFEFWWFLVKETTDCTWVAHFCYEKRSVLLLSRFQQKLENAISFWPICAEHPYGVWGKIEELAAPEMHINIPFIALSQLALLYIFKFYGYFCQLWAP